MAADSVRVIAQFKVKDEHVEEFQKRALAEMVAPTQSEPGCIAYDLWQDRNDPSRFSIVEEWATQEDLDRHLALPSLSATVARLQPMGDEPVRVGFYRLLEVSR